MPSPSNHSSARTRFATLCLEILLPFACVAVVSNCFFGSSAFSDFLDRYRPAFWEIPLNTHVEKQVLHISHDATLRQGKKILIVGSSSVVNAIDEQGITEYWKTHGVDYISRNYGLTGMLAYELPLLKNQLLTEDVFAVVYLYNHFSFGDILHPQAASTRWNTGEAISSGLWQHTSPKMFAKAMVAEAFFIVKYKNFIRTTLFNAVQGKLKPLQELYDFPAGWGNPATANRRGPRNDKAPDDWIRRSYIESAEKDDTLGTRALQRFLELADTKSVRVIVAPAPIPEFSRNQSYRNGIDENRIDARTQQLTLANKGIFIPRSEVAAIEEEDSYFTDDIHMGQQGREAYSRWLAQRILEIVR